RAEAVHLELEEADRRREVEEPLHTLCHHGVGARTLSWSSDDHVPIHGDPELLAPLEQLDVVDRPHALAHQLEDLAIEALDAWLDPAHACSREALDGGSLHVGLDLVEQRPAEIFLLQV